MIMTRNAHSNIITLFTTIKLPLPITSSNASKNPVFQPGCVPSPNGAKRFIMRLTHPDAEERSPESFDFMILEQKKRDSFAKDHAAQSTAGLSAP